jgi:hypothetical protein
MSLMSVDDDLDRLYQLPLDEFTAARNDVAKRAGARAADVKKLTKPPIAAWAVNQLYWKDRKVYDALVEAARELRAAHKAVLSGKRGDLRFAGKEHEDAIEKALKAALAILAGSGHPVTDATRHAIAQTLRALPADDPDGRLTRALQPGGFEMLAGIAVKGAGAGARAVKPAPGLKAGPSTAARPDAKHQKPAPEDRKLAEARDEATAAARGLREAEQTARRLEFEAARAARAAAKADEELTGARADLDAARKRLEEATTEATAAGRKDQAAKRATEAADRDLASARKRAEAADKALARLAPRS